MPSGTVVASAEAEQQTMSYAARVKASERLIAEMERSDDVEQIVRLHAQVSAHLRACEATVREAEGQIHEVRETKEAETA